MTEMTRGEWVRYIVALVFGALGLYEPATQGFWWLAANIACLAAAVPAMRWRRKHPVLVTIGVLVALVWCSAILPIAVWAYTSLATHRRWGVTALVGALFVVAIAGEAQLQIVAGNTTRSGASSLSPLAESIALYATMTGFVITLAAIGSYLGARRAEQTSMQERIALAERQAELAEREARAEERNRIAREMHDVLAHKISLIAMHAGALGYRDDLTPAEVQQAGRTIQSSAHEALSELRMILGQLRQKEGEDVLPPQPTLAQLDHLVEEHRATGAKVIVENSLAGEPSTTVSRQGYRIVQECLTNAAKHAPGVEVRLVVEGSKTEGVSIRATNALSLARGPGEGSRLGLIGLEERATAVSGRFHAGPTDAGEFEVEVWMPW